MKKLLIFFLIFILSSCNSYDINKDSDELNKKILELKRKSDLHEVIKNDIKDFSEINIEEINKDNISKFIYNKAITIDYLNNTNYNNLLKVLTILNKLSAEWYISNIDLRCNLKENKNPELLEILKNIKIKKLIINDACFFTKDSYQSNGWNFYDKEKVINFLKNTKYIDELDIWYIEYDIYKKENWEVKVYKEN